MSFDSSSNPRRPLVIAHRGASGLAPENTLAAFEMAIALGAHGIELDLQLSADGQAIVIHDRRLERTTNGRGAVYHCTAAELAELDAGSWFEKKLARRPRTRALIEALRKQTHSPLRLARQPVPTLEQILRLARQANLARLYLELKSQPANRDALLEQTLRLVQRFGLEESVTLLSFDHQAIKQTKTRAPHIRTAVTLPASSRRMIGARAIIAAVERAQADEAALHFGLVSRRTVAALQARGFSVSVWTANRPLRMRRLIACGVDAIMTNFPNRLQEVLASPA